MSNRNFGTRAVAMASTGVPMAYTPAKSPTRLPTSVMSTASEPAMSGRMPTTMNSLHPSAKLRVVSAITGSDTMPCRVFSFVRATTLPPLPTNLVWYASSYSKAAPKVQVRVSNHRIGQGGVLWEGSRTQSAR